MKEAEMRKESCSLLMLMLNKNEINGREKWKEWKMKEKCEGQRTLRLKLDDEARIVQLSKSFVQFCAWWSWVMRWRALVGWLMKEVFVTEFRDVERRKFWGSFNRAFESLSELVLKYSLETMSCEKSFEVDVWFKHFEALTNVS
jgi:hypothetical protein